MAINQRRKNCDNREGGLVLVNDLRVASGLGSQIPSAIAAKPCPAAPAWAGGTVLAKGPGVHVLRYASTLLFVIACDGDVRRQSGAPADRDAQAHYASEVVIPRVLEGLAVGPADKQGRPTVAPCGTCHQAADATPLPTSAEGIAGPHLGLSVTHGELTCAACHAPEARERLRLADARTIPLSSAMELCAQCHGPQKRDYDHGAHGGMRGYWDLSRGPRERNHCVACHDPHAPKFGRFMPVEGPRDRFSEKAQGAAHE